jgi:NCAIR mutase (PurE)-related protein
MDRDKIRDLLEKVRNGETGVADAMHALKMLPFEDLGFARTDNHRALRTGYPEVVYCMGKTIGQICTIVGASPRGTKRSSPAAPPMKCLTR